MSMMKVPITDVQTGKVRVHVYRGSQASLLALKKEILSDRKAFKPPGTAIHTPVPPGVEPQGFVASFLLAGPLVIEDDKSPPNG